MADKFEIKKVYINEEKYPELLRQIKDPPQVLYYAGDLSLTEKTCAAVVGSRRASEYGRWVASVLGEKIAGAGGVVVSGMAAGIDTCAHWGAVNGVSSGIVRQNSTPEQFSNSTPEQFSNSTPEQTSNTKPEQTSNTSSARRIPTIAVLGSGLDICFPKGNLRLRDLIAQHGLLLSEYPPGTRPTRFTFPRRNRIISGLSRATVVVQAPNTSGALITAEMAADQGRNVYAVPGNINSEYHFGSNKLLRDGAMPLVVIDDLIEDLGLLNEKHISIEENFGEDEKVVLKTLCRHGEMTEDQLCAATGMVPSQVAGLVTILEMKGAVYSYLGKIFIAK